MSNTRLPHLTLENASRACHLALYTHKHRDTALEQVEGSTCLFHDHALVVSHAAEL